MKAALATVALPFALLLLAVNLGGSAGKSGLSFTKQQAWQGRLSYYEHCAECHGGDLGGEIGPALAGPDSELQWETPNYVWGYMTAHMPHGDPGALPQRDYVNIIAFILEQHGRTAGGAELTAKAIDADKTPIGGERGRRPPPYPPSPSSTSR